MREGLLSGVTGKWQETNRKPVPWLMFVMSLGAGAAAAILEIQLCTSPDADNRLNPHASFVVSRQCHWVALVNGDNDGILGVVVLMVLHIAAGLVSALLSISRLTLTGQRPLIFMHGCRQS